MMDNEEATDLLTLCLDTEEARYDALGNRYKDLYLLNKLRAWFGFSPALETPVVYLSEQVDLGLLTVLRYPETHKAFGLVVHRLGQVYGTRVVDSVYSTGHGRVSLSGQRRPASITRAKLVQPDGTDLEAEVILVQ